VGVVGPSIDALFFVNGVRIRCTIDVYGDFAMLRSYALERYMVANALDSDIRKVLADGNYYYGIGLSQSLAVSVNYRRFEVGARVQGHYLTSINGLYRLRSQITGRYNFQDYYTEMEIPLGYDLTDRWRAEVAFKLLWRGGKAEGPGGSYAQDDTAAQLGLYLKYRWE
jgi:hypothetical protein